METAGSYDRDYSEQFVEHSWQKRLNGSLLKEMPVLKPTEKTLSRRMVLAEVITYLEMRKFWNTWVSPKSIRSIFIKDRKKI